MNLKQINSNITRVHTSSAALNALIQATAVGIIAHAKEHGDANAAVRLVHAMPKSLRRGLLVKFFAIYSPIRLSINSKDNTKSRCSIAKVGTEGYTEYNLDGANANLWHEVPGSEVEPGLDTLMEFDAKLLSFAKAWEAKLANKKVKRSSVDVITSRIAALKALAADVKTSTKGATGTKTKVTKTVKKAATKRAAPAAPAVAAA